MIVSGINQQTSEMMFMVLERCCEKKMVDLFGREQGCAHQRSKSSLTRQRAEINDRFACDFRDTDPKVVGVGGVVPGCVRLACERGKPKG